MARAIIVLLPTPIPADGHTPKQKQCRPAIPTHILQSLQALITVNDLVA
jgi:hypothetical protein